MAIVTPPTDRLQTAREAAERLRNAQTLEDLRRHFLELYPVLGWRTLCRMAFLGQSPERALRLEQRIDE